ncbi:LuxR C-terminal-related transcriptional regulator [Microvirga pudoricolor]|uniref:LuxR C-terminal-related transcriptional regulator n=1 Tax=Microvirga pudoricolor TaxID=2778729 RepID=UPI001950BA34|nr:response regulator transcription factor [Microvirga pudoricolor]MBM6594482.1 response regulator transcription factor [Microvirga pudoricolor]
MSIGNRDATPQSGQKTKVDLQIRNLLLRAGLESILSGGGFEVVASGDPGTARADLIIVEAAGQLLATLDQIAAAKAACPEARIALLADTYDAGLLIAAREAGVDGLIAMIMKPETLIKSLEMLMLGELVIPSDLGRALLAQARSLPPAFSQAREPVTSNLGMRIHNLSPREADVLRHLKNGAPNKIIARECDLAEATVKVHVKSILRKIGAANRTQAALWASDHFTTGEEVRAGAEPPVRVQ